MIERHYEVLGAHLAVRCAFAACADAVAAHHGPMAAAPWTTPDWIVECDLPRAPRALFRTRPGSDSVPLEGVSVRFAGGMAQAWTSAEPPLLPLSSPPLRDRVVGLHAASIALGAANCLVIAGNRGTGKTTLAITLASTFDDAALMGDEWAFLLRRTAVCLPYPQAPGIRDPAGGKAWRPADTVVPRVATRPREVTAIVVLEPHVGIAPGHTSRERPPPSPLSPAGLSPEPIPPHAAFAKLQSHVLSTGCDRDEAMVTVARLAREVPVARLAPVPYKDRAAAADGIWSWAAAVAAGRA